MSLLSRLLGTAPDPREALRPLWHRTVAIAREPQWYAECGVADTLAGRFDMITAVLALVVLRLEEAGKASETALLTELFVEDMDAQLRESGVGDVGVGKRMGRLMEALGGRLQAYRAALASPTDEALDQAVTRNVTLVDEANPATLSARLRGLAADIAAADPDALVAGRIAR